MKKYAALSTAIIIAIAAYTFITTRNRGEAIRGVKYIRDVISKHVIPAQVQHLSLHNTCPSMEDLRTSKLISTDHAHFRYAEILVDSKVHQSAPILPECRYIACFDGSVTKLLGEIELSYDLSGTISVVFPDGTTTDISKNTDVSVVFHGR